MTLPIPDIALDDCGAILGRRGSGKSATKQLFLEYDLRRNRRVCLIDPKGDSWGIRLTRNGFPSPYQIPIFGGSRGDIALTADMGAALGRMVATVLDLSCIVDLSSFALKEMETFAADFTESLFDNNRHPITLYVDEADQLAPQKSRASIARLLFQMERLVRMGRQRGISMWMLTQRPQVISKNVLSQAESLIAMKMSAPYDRKAVREWLEAHDPDHAAQIEQELAGLSVGEGFMNVPRADYLERVQFPLFATYDSGRTPRHGEPLCEAKPPPLDVSRYQRFLGLPVTHVPPPPAPFPGDTVESFKAHIDWLDTLLTE